MNDKQRFAELEHRLSHIEDQVNSSSVIKFEINIDQIRQVIHEEVTKAVNEVTKYHQFQLPPMLTRKQLMELFNISQTKTSELLNRADFPVFREAGVLIPTHLLFRWIEKHTRWVEENTSFFKKTAM
ncbi:hypothetical protein B4168_2451 [Anoxybacillus flavithermus]|nr:hypothetical protein [Parageobacillus thermoglucosidasius]EID42891.1 putative phage protein [Parageobacillus thermoglucosidasius TNO-09.020]KYD17890.1 hypothetical protein B4168_2451 [Anoxybacillus flavithermus]OAO85329.1 hypothetical protein GT23_3020 [Parageobacillus thermoglucosidasius]